MAFIASFTVMFLRIINISLRLSLNYLNESLLMNSILYQSDEVNSEKKLREACF